MIRALVKLGMAFVIVYFAWNVGPVYVASQRFRSEVAQTTRDVGRGPEQELVTAIMALATRVGVPLDADDIRVRKDRTYTYLDLSYTEQLQLLPTMTYPWTFLISAQGLSVTPRPWNGPAR
jgi:hypothetical protein